MENGWQQMLPAVPALSWINRGELPVSASAVSASTAMETASAAMHTAGAAVETTAAAAETAGAAAAVEPAGAAVEAMISAPEAAVVKATASAKATSAETASLEAASTETASVEVAIAETASEKAAVEPRSGADKDATRKVVWTVVAVRRTRIWVIPVVAVGANRSGSYITGTNSNANGHLSVGVTCRKH